MLPPPEGSYEAHLCDQVRRGDGSRRRVPPRHAGLPLKFALPHWSEFATDETTLALHPASEKNPAGTVELGVGVPDLQKFYEEMSARGVIFSVPPTKQDFGGMPARFPDSEGRATSVAGV
jgi:hypothetical protein